MKGVKTGGRHKGTPNKLTQTVREILAELNCNSIEGMALLAMDKNNTPELRGRMYAELAQYEYSKRRAVELSGIDGAPVEVNVTNDLISQVRSLIAARSAK